ncbi:hypothetical protein TKV_c11100 [Thermoanaerobacter kivui]|uniref:Uncharacterized protein n=1 Tax=Thermoanaerobacter kivui TaxID=2325 RepID=A0A097AR57_THEKI|nr:hypothetical protein [Thermoanaerobacter kivui]AIS52283.1 hypothetical protein TKV_c11100 [Thermoanaerobacter kivui]
MERETSTSKKLMIEEFTRLSDLIKSKYGVSLWLVEIMGRRHSYVAGHKEESFLPPQVIYLNEEFAVVSNNWDKIPEKEKKKLINHLKMFSGT